MVKSKDMEFFHGQTAKSTLATGWKGSKMAKENTREVISRVKKGFGKMERGFGGLIKKMKLKKC